MELSNIKGIHKFAAVWLAQTSYYDDQPEIQPGMTLISATTLLKPIRMTVLGLRSDELLEPEQEMLPIDVLSFIAPKFGTAIHDSFEKAWTDKRYVGPLKRLDIPEHIIDKIVVNPTEQQAKQDIIPIYLERRAERNVDDFTITGKFDAVFNGDLMDIKTTGTYAYRHDSNRRDYIIQGSIYRWLNPDLISSDDIKIVYVFNDWSSRDLKNQKDYPEDRIVVKSYPLMSLEDTEKWIRNRLNEFRTEMDKPIDLISLCSDAELWKDPPEHKYYSDPAKIAEGGKCTRNFKDDAFAAQAYKDEKGKGEVFITTPLAKRCNYCNVQGVCKQYASMLEKGEV